MRRKVLRRLKSRRRPPRVLVAIPGGEYGGAERYAVRIAAAVAQEGWEVAASVRRYDALAPMRSDLRDAGVRVLPMVRGERTRELVGFAAMLALYRPDVVHLTLSWPVAAGRFRAACALLGIPTVLVHAAVADAAVLDVHHAWLYRLARRRRQQWVAVSAYGATMLTRAFGLRPTDEITIIHNGQWSIPAERNGRSVLSDPRARGDARAAWGLVGDGPVIVTIGRLSYEKGHDVLVAAARRLAAEWPRMQILIAGEGDGRAALEQLIDEAGLGERVRLLGQVQDVAGLLRTADVFAFPSRREGGSPLALLEAMTVGVPVVAADFGGVDEILYSGENGIVFPRDDADALATAIRDLLREPARAHELALRGRERSADFSEAVMIRRTLAVLADAAGGMARSCNHRAGHLETCT